jgi:DNA-binding beta-propeller fold protein YncE
MDVCRLVCIVRPVRLVVAFAAVFGTCLFSTNGNSQDQADYEIVTENLLNPRAVAIQPDTGHVFVAESGGLRVVRVVDGQTEEVVTGFSKDYTGKSPIYEIGPLGLAFLDKNTLLIGDGGREAGMDQIRVVDVPDAGEPPVQLKRDVDKRLRLQADDQHEANGNFWAMTRLEDYLFVTCGDDMRKGWVARTPIRANRPTSLKRFFSTVRSVKSRNPYAITTSPEGEIVVSQAGESKDDDDSLLVFFGPDGDFLDSFQTGLNDIYGLAYGPNRGRLYAVDFCQAKPNEGGLFKLVGTREGCRAVRFAKLPRPSALAFDDNGDLYVTTVGRFVEGAQVSNGRLLRFKGLDNPQEQN